MKTGIALISYVNGQMYLLYQRNGQRFIKAMEKMRSEFTFLFSAINLIILWTGRHIIILISKFRKKKG
jgi:succinate dehydrogenase hydrophobic anchor subunit